MSPLRAPSDDELETVVVQLTGARSLPVSILRQVGRAFRVRADSPFHLEIHRRKLPNASVADFTVSEMALRRLPFSRPDAAHLLVVREGVIVLDSTMGERHTLTAGDMCIVTRWSDYDLSCLKPARVTHLLFSESRLRDRGVRLRADRVLIAAPPSLREPIVALVGSVVDREWMSTATSLRVIDRALEDLAVGLLLERGDTGDEHDEQRAVLRAKALEEIAERHRDRALAPALLAKYLGVSLRHLQRAFEHSGSTIADQIASRRTMSAADLLASPHGRTLTVSEIARASGFASAFELRSAFRARFGQLPSDYRVRGIVAPASEDSRANRESDGPDEAIVETGAALLGTPTNARDPRLPA